MGDDRLLLLCERGGFAPLHQAVSAGASWLAAGGRCDLVLFHAALFRVMSAGLDEVEDALPAAASYREAMLSGRVRPVSQILAEARREGLGVFACSASVALLGLEPDEALAAVDEVIGWPTILAWMGASDRVLYL